MGQSFKATCKKCKKKFPANDGGGFFFHKLHCDKCGKEKDIAFEKLGDTHLRYLKGLEGPYSVVSSEHDKYVRENYLGEPLKEEEYNKAVEEFAGKCKCGGQFSMEAPIRCPKCKSDDIDLGEAVINYD